MTYEDFAATVTLGLAPAPLLPFTAMAAGVDRAMDAAAAFPPLLAGAIQGAERLFSDAADDTLSFDFLLAASASGAALLAGVAADPAEATATALSPGGTTGGYTLLPDDPDPTMTGNDGVDDEETGGDATVIGYREESYAGGGTSGGGADGGSDGTGSGDYGGTGGDSETTQGNDCRDRHALQAQATIEAKADDYRIEYGSLIYVVDGNIYHSPPIQGTYKDVPVSAVESWMADSGVTYADVIGFIHNHPAKTYGTTNEAIAVNAYPSFGDWGFMDYIVAKGAGGLSGDKLALYIVSPDKELREFAYPDRTKYKDLTDGQKIDEINLPAQITDDGTSC
jgi:hypothetical protein